MRKLTDMQVRELRRLSSEGVPAAQLAAQFSCSEIYAGQLARGDARPEAGGDIRTWRKKLPAEEILARRQAGESPADLAAEYGVAGNDQPSGSTLEEGVKRLALWLMIVRASGAATRLGLAKVAQQLDVALRALEETP